MVASNDGPADKADAQNTVENLTEGRNSSPNSQPAAKKATPHPTHTVQWCGNDKKPTTITCNKAQTVGDLLKQSSQFRCLAGKNKTKELVVVRDGRAISSHFPCSLIKDKRLTVKYVKADGKSAKPAHSSPRTGPASELVMFDVSVRGDKNVVKIIRNPALRTIFQEVTVYAFKGEKVKQALKRDGRFLNIIFNKNCGLSNLSTEVNTEMSNLVDDLHDKTFKIILLNRSIVLESPPSSLEEEYVEKSEPERSDSGGNQDSSEQSATIKSENGVTLKGKPTLPGEVAPAHEIPSSGKLQTHLSSHVNRLLKNKAAAAKLSRSQNLFRVEFGQNAQICNEVQTMKKLMELSSSVCHVRINGSSAGSGFLLFGNYVLTNGHVIKNIYDDHERQLYEKLTVHFSYESLEQMEGGQAEVEEVVGFEFCVDEPGRDWALLKLCADQKLPVGFLTRVGPVPQTGGICIIGHPDGGVKKIDPCFIIPPENRNEVVKRHNRENQEHIQLITNRFFEGVAESVQRLQQTVTYESCFYFGSSGSPVFDKYCNVVAMHSGGYSYKSGTGATQSVIEFGHPLVIIVARFIVQMLDRKRFDVLEEFVNCPFAQPQNIMTTARELLDRETLANLKNAVSTGDQSLRTFIQFFTQKEEPVPMDID